MEAIQKCQNKLLRVLNGTCNSDKISIKTMLTSLGMLSVNQINAQIKICEMWKSTRIPKYPIKTELIQRPADVANTRAVSLGELKEGKLSNASQRTFLNDAMHIWNKTPINIGLNTVSNSGGGRILKKKLTTYVYSYF